MPPVMLLTTNPPRLNRTRAIVTFVVAYVAITILGTALSLACSAMLGAPMTAEPMQNAGYLLSERFLPMLNLLVWMALSWAYFKGRRIDELARREALRLGIFWLALALPIDFACFVCIKSPISLSTHDFYVGQFPWIYLIYIAVLVSPWCFVVVSSLRGAKRAN